MKTRIILPGKIERNLCLEEIGELKETIKFDVGGEIGIIEGRIVSTSIPKADGYAIISWTTNQFYKDRTEKPIELRGYFYPVEEVGPRLKEDKKREESCGPAKRLITLAKRNDGIYQFIPSNRITGVSYIYPDSIDYKKYATRLKQEELFLR